MHDAARRVLHYYPLTLPGTALAAAAVYLLGSAFASGSPHEFLLSIIGFLALLVLAGLGRLQAYRCKLVEFEWDSSAPRWRPASMGPSTGCAPAPRAAGCSTASTCASSGACGRDGAPPCAATARWRRRAAKRRFRCGFRAAAGWN